MTVGGILTGLCGLLFVSIYEARSFPSAPITKRSRANPGSVYHSGLKLVVFGLLKLAATIVSLAAGGVSAMFVPLFLSGGSFGIAFGQFFVQSSSVKLYAAVGMAAFISAGYKTPLAAVVFVAEATGGHAFIIPALIGSAVAYAVSGDASVSGDQQLHEGAKAAEADAAVPSVAEIIGPQPS